MSEAVARATLELGASLGDHSSGIVFFGGEPLLRRQLIEATVDYARRMETSGEGRFHFKLTTNGLLLDDSFIQYSKDNDVLVALSFDGIREAHDSHRRLAGGGATFDLLLERLRALLAARPYASILLTVNPDTASFLSDSVAFLMDEGARYIIVSLNYEATWSKSDLRVLERQYKRLGQLYIDWTREGRKFYLSPLEMKLSSHIKGDAYQADRCELGQRQLSVAPDGGLYPCVQFSSAGPGSEWYIGSVQTGIDEQARARIRTRSLVEKDPCFRCAIRKRCNHTCGCINRQATGSVDGISPVLCRSEQMLMAVADQVGETLFRERNDLFLNKHYNDAYPVLSALEDLS